MNHTHCSLRRNDAGYLVYAADARGSGRSAADGYGMWGTASWPGSTTSHA